jgi:hypothetical protein
MIELKFNKINHFKKIVPKIEVQLNETEIYKGPVKSCINIGIIWLTDIKTNTLQIHFINKGPEYTETDSKNTIIHDLNFTLESITIDDVDFKHLIWQSRYVTDSKSIKECLFFGPKGYFEIQFSTPVQRWFLETDHRLNNSNPYWKEDYALHNRTLAYYQPD